MSQAPEKPVGAGDVVEGERCGDADGRCEDGEGRCGERVGRDGEDGAGEALKARRGMASTAVPDWADIVGSVGMRRMKRTSFFVFLGCKKEYNKVE